MLQITSSYKKAVVLLGLLVMGLICSVQSAQAIVIQLHVINSCSYEAWSPPEGDSLVIWVGESQTYFSPSWSAGYGTTAITSIDLGSIDPANITQIDIWGYTWTDETMTEASPVGGNGAWTGTYIECEVGP